uniref:Uncharacterized protein n=1 Tax=Triticum urartu TaxID=4572 RepID=A0A8R7Q4V3_TRIUA
MQPIPCLCHGSINPSINSLLLKKPVVVFIACQLVYDFHKFASFILSTLLLVTSTRL